MITEREHWLSITDDPEWKRNHINDPNISLTETVDAIASAFQNDPHRILEIGSGYGRLTWEMHRMFPQAEVWGLDINPAVIKAAEQYDPKTVFVCGDNLYGLSADAIYSVAVFQHLTSEQKRIYIGQAYDALTEGGVLRVQFIEGERDNFCDHWTPEDQMIDWLDDAGFDVTMQTGLAHPQWTWLTAVK